MYIHDIYILGQSSSFELKALEEAVVDLKLKRVQSCCHTLFIGKVLCRNVPIRNATVMVMDDKCSPLSSAVTDENGIFRFNNIKPGMYKAIASANGHDPSEIKTVLIDCNEATKLTFTLKKSLISENGIVYGKVLESGSRKPVENAEICLKSLNYEHNMICKTKSNHNGQYLIYNISPGNYRIMVQKKGYISTESLVIKIDKQSRLNLYFDLIKSSSNYNNTISGRIIKNKVPITKLPVFLYLLDKEKNEKIVQIQETNENGLYLFSNVESGSYLVKSKLQNSVIYEKPFIIS